MIDKYAMLSTARQLASNQADQAYSSYCISSSRQHEEATCMSAELRQGEQSLKRVAEAAMGWVQ